MFQLYLNCKIIKQKTMKIQVIIFFCVLVLAFGRQVEVPAIRVPTQLDIKVGRLQQVTQPNFNFKQVQSRRVFKTDNNSMSSFSICTENKPEVYFTIKDQILFGGETDRSDVIYRFEDIQYSQFLLDTFLDQDKLYMLFQDCNAAVVELSNKKINKQLVNGLQPNTRLQPGFFVKVNGNVIFVNNKYAILFNGTNTYNLQGYQGGKFFQNVLSIQEMFLAVAYQQTGVVFYKIVEKKLQKVYTLNSTQITSSGQARITDLAYYKSEKSLLILDQDQGILSFTLSANQIGLKLNKGPIILKRQACDMIFLNDDVIHVVCNQIYRVSLKNWPRIQEKTLPHPNIKVRQIFVQGPLVAFVGRSVFRLMYHDRLVNYYEDQRMDKMIFKKDMFISSNQGGILFGKYQIIQPYITCQAKDPKFAGSYYLVFKTVAECNKDYLHLSNINIEALGQIGPDDTCVYTIFRNIYFWKTGTIMLMPIFVVLSILIVIAIIVTSMWILKKISISRVQRQLAEYTSLTGTSQNPKHQELVEQAAQSGNNKSGASNKIEEEQDYQKKPSQLEMQNQMHDIE